MTRSLLLALALLSQLLRPLPAQEPPAPPVAEATTTPPAEPPAAEVPPVTPAAPKAIVLVIDPDAERSTVVKQVVDALEKAGSAKSTGVEGSPLMSHESLLAIVRTRKDEPYENVVKAIERLRELGVEQVTLKTSVRDENLAIVVCGPKTSREVVQRVRLEVATLQNDPSSPFRFEVVGEDLFFQSLMMEDMRKRLISDHEQLRAASPPDPDKIENHAKLIASIDTSNRDILARWLDSDAWVKEALDKIEKQVADQRAQVDPVLLGQEFEKFVGKWELVSDSQRVQPLRPGEYTIQFRHEADHLIATTQDGDKQSSARVTLRDQEYGTFRKLQVIPQDPFASPLRGVYDFMHLNTRESKPFQLALCLSHSGDYPESASQRGNQLRQMVLMAVPPDALVTESATSYAAQAETVPAFAPQSDSAPSADPRTASPQYKQELARFVGKWQEASRKTFILEFKLQGDQLHYIENARGRYVRGAVKLDLDATPHRLEMNPGGNSGKLFLGLYAWDGLEEASDRPPRLRLAVDVENYPVSLDDSHVVFERMPNLDESGEAGVSSNTAKVFALQHAQAAEVVEVLKQVYDRGPAKFAADPRSNSVIVSGTSEQLMEIEALLRKLDETGQATPEAQVAPLNPEAFQQIVQLQDELATLRQSVGPKHPKVLELQAHLDQALTNISAKEVIAFIIDVQNDVLLEFQKERDAVAQQLGQDHPRVADLNALIAESLFGIHESKNSNDPKKLEGAAQFLLSGGEVWWMFPDKLEKLRAERELLLKKPGAVDPKGIDDDLSQLDIHIAQLAVMYRYYERAHAKRQAIAEAVRPGKSVADTELQRQITQLRKEYEAADAESHQLVEQLRQPGSKGSQDELRQAVSRAFTARQKLLRAELLEMQTKLLKTQQSIEMREKISDQIIQRRVEDLLNPQLEWNEESPSVSPSPAIGTPQSTTRPMTTELEGNWHGLSMTNVEGIPLAVPLCNVTVQGDRWICKPSLRPQLVSIDTERKTVRFFDARPSLYQYELSGDRLTMKSESIIMTLARGHDPALDRTQASRSIPKGMRIFTYRSNDTITNSGLLQPGDKVDVTVTFTDRKGNVVTRTLLECIEVFAVENSPAHSEESRNDQRSRSVSLLVTPEQDGFIKVAHAKGQLALSLRNPNDDEVSNPNGVNSQCWEELKRSVGADDAPGVEASQAEREETPLVTLKAAMLAKLQGDWSFRGQPVDKDEPQGLRTDVNIKGDLMTFKLTLPDGRQGEVSHQLKLGEAGPPQQIDVIFDPNGGTQRMEMKGIIEIDEEVVRICVDNSSDSQRPEVFAAGSSAVIWELRRQPAVTELEGEWHLVEEYAEGNLRQPTLVNLTIHGDRFIQESSSTREEFRLTVDSQTKELRQYDLIRENTYHPEYYEVTGHRLFLRQRPDIGNTRVFERGHLHIPKTLPPATEEQKLRWRSGIVEIVVSGNSNAPNGGEERTIGLGVMVSTTGQIVANLGGWSSQLEDWQIDAKFDDGSSVRVEVVEDGGDGWRAFQPKTAVQVHHFFTRSTASVAIADEVYVWGTTANNPGVGNLSVKNSKIMLLDRKVSTRHDLVWQLSKPLEFQNMPVSYPVLAENGELLGMTIANTNNLLLAIPVEQLQAMLPKTFPAKTPVEGASVEPNGTAPTELEGDWHLVSRRDHQGKEERFRPTNQTFRGNQRVFIWSELVRPLRIEVHPENKTIRTFTPDNDGSFTEDFYEIKGNQLWLRPTPDGQSVTVYERGLVRIPPPLPDVSEEQAQKWRSGIVEVFGEWNDEKTLTPSMRLGYGIVVSNEGAIIGQFVLTHPEIKGYFARCDDGSLVPLERKRDDVNGNANRGWSLFMPTTPTRFNHVFSVADREPEVEDLMWVYDAESRKLIRTRLTSKSRLLVSEGHPVWQLQPEVEGQTLKPSGQPVFSRDGHVLGVTYQGTGDLLLATPLSQLRTTFPELLGAAESVQGAETTEKAAP